MGKSDIWNNLDIAVDVDECNFCGQELLDGLCPSCFNCMHGIIYEVCRNLLLNEGMQVNSKEIKKKEKDDDEPSPREVAISKLLDEIPAAIAKRTSREQKVLMEAGVWFSHLVAYSLVKDLRKNKKTTPPQLIADDVYIMVRDQVFDFVRKSPMEITPDMRETILNFYNLPSAEDDARKVIYYMIIELEKDGRLKIDRGSSLCSSCGVEIEKGNLCSSCEQDEKMQTRRAIASATSLSSPQENEKASSIQAKTMRAGMYIRKK